MERFEKTVNFLEAVGVADARPYSAALQGTETTVRARRTVQTSAHGNAAL